MKFVFLFVLLVTYFFSNFMRISGVVILPPLAQSMGLSAATIGLLSSLYFYTYGGSYGLWGALVDKKGAFLCCGIGLLMVSAGSFVLMTASAAWGVGLGRALCGLGMPAAFTGILTYCAVAFSKETYAAYVGLCLLAGNSGTIAAVAPLGKALGVMGPRGVFCLLGCAAAVLALILLAGRRFDAQLPKIRAEGKRLDFREILGDLTAMTKTIWRCYPLRVVMLTWSASSGALSTLQGLWAVSWLQTATGAPHEAARMAATWISIGLVCGSAVGGFVYKLFENEKRVFFVVCCLNLAGWAAWALLSLAAAPLAAFSIAGAEIGFCNACGYVFLGKSVRCLVPVSQNGSAIGMINMHLYAVVIACQWGSGFVVDHFAKGAGVYTETGFLLAFTLITLFQAWMFLLVIKVKSFDSAERTV